MWEWPDEGGHLNRDKTVWLWVHPGDVKTLAHHPTNQGDVQKIQARQEEGCSMLASLSTTQGGLQDTPSKGDLWEYELCSPNYRDLSLHWRDDLGEVKNVFGTSLL